MKNRLLLAALFMSVGLSLHAPPPTDYPGGFDFGEESPFGWSPGPSPDSSPSATACCPMPERLIRTRAHRRRSSDRVGHYAPGVPRVRVDRLRKVNGQRYLDAIPMAEESYVPDPALKERVNRWLNWVEASSAWDGELPDLGNGRYARDRYFIDRNEYDGQVGTTPYKGYRNGRAWPAPGRIRPQKQHDHLPELH